MKRQKKVVLIAFYDRTCESIRILSSVLKDAGHVPYLIFFKDDRSGVINEFIKNNKYYQLIVNHEFLGCGEDFYPPSESEIDLLIKKIQEIGPDVIGFSARSATRDLVKTLTLRLKEVLPEVRYIGGGYGPTLEPETFLEFLDYVCLGEGYKAIVDLVESEDPTTKENICYLKNGELHYNALAKYADLEELCYPDWSYENKFMIEENKVSPICDFYDTKTYNITASIGCPSKCTYCQASQLGMIYNSYGYNYPRIRLRSPQNVLKELMWAKEEHDIKYVRFFDSVFGFKGPWFYEFMDLYDKHIGLKFICFLDERWADEQVIKRLVASGMMRSVVGIQSTSEKIRKEIMGRNNTNESIIRFAENLCKYDVQFKYDIVLWNPFETSEILSEGVDFLRKLPKGERVDVFQLKVFPGSPLHKMIKEKKPNYLDDNEYEYWAWIYQLILRGDDAERIADFAMQYDSFKKNPRILKSLIKEVANREKSKYRVFAARDLSKNERITSVKLIRKRSDLERAISYDKVDYLVAKIMRRDVKEDEPITVDDIFGTYEDKMPFV